MSEVPLCMAPSGVFSDPGVRYRGTSLIRNSLPLGPCSRAMPRALRCSYGEVLFLMSEVPLYAFTWALRENGNSLPNNQRQRRTCSALCQRMYPVSAALASFFRMDFRYHSVELDGFVGSELSTAT